MDLDKAYNDNPIEDNSLLMIILNSHFENSSKEVCEYLDDMLVYCAILDKVNNIVDEPFGKVVDEPFGKVVDEPFGKVVDEPFGKVVDEPFGKVVDEPSGRVVRKGIKFVLEKIGILKMDSKQFLPILKELLNAGLTEGHVIFVICYFRGYWEKNLRHITYYKKPKYAIASTLDNESAWKALLESIHTNDCVIKF